MFDESMSESTHVRRSTRWSVRSGSRWVGGSCGVAVAALDGFAEFGGEVEAAGAVGGDGEEFAVDQMVAADA